MEIVSIVLCFVSGVVVTSIIMALLGMKNEITDLQKQAENFKFQTETNNALFREIEGLNSAIKHDIGEIYRYVDSRHDKLENKLVDIVKNGCEPAKSK